MNRRTSFQIGLIAALALTACGDVALPGGGLVPIIANDAGLRPDTAITDDAPPPAVDAGAPAPDAAPDTTSDTSLPDGSPTVTDAAPTADTVPSPDVTPATADAGTPAPDVQPSPDATPTPDTMPPTPDSSSAVPGTPFVTRLDSGSLIPQAIARDSSGNVYVSGAFFSSIELGTVTLTSQGGWDLFVIKLNSAGDVVWGRSLGSNGFERGGYIAVDPQTDHVVFCGRFENTLYTQGHAPIEAWLSDVIVGRLDSDGNWVWLNRIGSLGYEDGTGIATDAAGNAIIIGDFGGTIDFGGATLVGSGGFVAKLNPQGNALWAKKISGSVVAPTAVATSSTGSIAVAGKFRTSTTVDGMVLNAVGYEDVFIYQLSSSGSPTWSVRGGGATSYQNRAGDLAYTADGALYLTGTVQSAGDLDGLTFTTSGATDGFIARFDNGGATWIRILGGAGTEQGLGIHATADGRALFSGEFEDQLSIDGRTIFSYGGSDGYAGIISSAGTVNHLETLGGGLDDTAKALTQGPEGTIYLLAEVYNDAVLRGQVVSGSGNALLITAY